MARDKVRAAVRWMDPSDVLGSARAHGTCKTVFLTNATVRGRAWKKPVLTLDVTVYADGAGRGAGGRRALDGNP